MYPKAEAIGFFMGALFATFLLSRFALLILRRWKGALWRPVVANAASFAFVCGVGWFLRGPEWRQALGAYALAQLLCLGIDLWRWEGARGLPRGNRSK